MNLQEQFELKVSEVNNLKNKPADGILLQLYGLYKQSMVGDCNTDKPNMFQMKESAKWDAWNKRKGLSKEEAMKKYINVVNQLLQ